MIALPLVAFKPGYEIELLYGFDSFRDDLEADAARERNDRADDRLVGATDRSSNARSVATGTEGIGCLRMRPAAAAAPAP